MSGTITPTPISLLDQPTLVQNMTAAAQAQASAPFSVTAGSVVLALVEAVASVGLWFQWLCLLCLSRSRLATSAGADCDTFGADFGFARLAAVAATGNVTFARFSSTVAASIPIGAQVKSSDGTQIFATTAAATIPIGTSSASVAVQAQTGGTGGNVLANTITLLATAIPGVDTVTNAAAFTNGVAAETDAAFRARFVAYIGSLAKATSGAVGAAILGVQQGLSYSIAENVSTTGAYQPGNFVVTVDDGSGAPPSGTIAAVSAAVNAVRGVGITYAVQPPSLITAAVSLTITVLPGYVKANMTAAVVSAISAYINALPVGTALPWSRIAQVAYDSQAGIANVTAVLVNGATADLGGGTTQVVRAGIVSVS